jgi:dTDP-4-amino-4,6-dideoxygalactose transaminase
MKSIYCLERQNVEGCIAAMRAVIGNKNFILGKEITMLEKALSNFVNMRYGVAVSSGTSALFLLLKALKIGPGHVVFVPNFTFLSTATAAKMVGATPIFIDIDKDTFTMDSTHLHLVIDRHYQQTPAAIIPVDIFGRTYDPNINIIAKNYNMVVIEDACHSFGSLLGGSMSDISFTSFFPTKPLGAWGDAGMIFTNYDGLKNNIELLRNHAMTAKNVASRLGYNMRMDTIQAAVLLEKFSAYQRHLASREAFAKLYKEGLDRRKYSFQNDYGHNNAYFSIVCKRRTNRANVISHLHAYKIPFDIYYRRPLHTLDVFQMDMGHRHYDFKGGEFKVSSYLCNNILQIPMNPYLTNNEVDKIITVLNGVK